MATYSSQLRRGLPRVNGGDAWPPPGPAPETLVAQVASAAPPVGLATSTASASPVEEPRDVTGDPVAASVASAPPAAAVVAVPIRRGLPRVRGGESWPPADLTVAIQGGGSAPPTTAASATSSQPTVAAAGGAQTVSSGSISAAAAAAPHVAAANSLATLSDVPLRRGLPRVAGGEPWPPAGFAPAVATSPAPAPAAPADPPAAGSEETRAPAAKPGPRNALPASAPSSPDLAPAAARTAPATQQPAAQVRPPAAVPARATPNATPAPAPKAEPVRIGGRTVGQWAKRVLLFGGGAVVAAGIVVLAARGVTTLPGVSDFMTKYPGSYDPPEFVEPGIPVWARWTHYLNFFFMVLVVRTGLLVRTEQRPSAFYTPRRGGKKVSIYRWLHTSLDLLWLLNGAVFVVLLFTSGRWARIVPTSWEVFPNALSAMLQYLTLEWPTESGWVNYNSLQQLTYFVVVFVAAPLAAVTGVRMSDWWPQEAKTLNRIYPAPLARAIHFPTMLFFVLFVIGHVFLVFTTGALTNLNHMFAGTTEVSWVGFGLFALGFAVAAAALLAVRPIVIAPIASLFGKVSAR